MGKGGYLGGSTVVRAFPKLSGRKRPKKGAVDTWVAEAKASGIPIPDGIRLNPINGAQPSEKKKNENAIKGKKKKKQVGSGGKTKPIAKGRKPVTRKPNEPLPEFAVLVEALREKYSK
ncbi:MAG: hypothetical protein P8P66_00865 [Paracoccaceae bacterium]|nr:hypothetical protein [Paracoccaceae bacterium]